MKAKSMNAGSPAPGAARRGPEAFESFYAGLYAERWKGLKDALLARREAMAWSYALTAEYLLDPASVLAALALPPCPGGECIDLCAAPGGKSLVLAGRITNAARLTANERSQERSARLKRVLDEHLPKDARLCVSVSTQDAASMCRKRPQAFDRILLDAPCSSERHVLSSMTHLGLWTPARAKSLAMGQWALLSSAFLMLKPGGVLAYATCSINPGENDGVMARLQAKHGEEAVIEAPRPAIAMAIGELEENGLPESQARELRRLLGKGEETAHGLAFLPDRCEGAGPMYVGIARKKSRPSL